MKLRSGPFKGKEVVIGEQDVVDRHADVADEILDCIGIRRAMVTDMSELSDFTIGDPPEDRAEHLRKVNDQFGLALTSAHVTFPVLIEMILRSRAEPTKQ